MSESTELRIRRLVREILTVHLDAFLTLLAEEESSMGAQRERMDKLVRALGAASVNDTVTNGGRQVPIKVDMSADPPTIELHRKLIDSVGDDEILVAFQKPVSQILQISPVGVGLVLQCRDDRQLKSLANKAARELDTQRALLTQVPAVVEQRMSLFEERLSEFAEQFGDTVFLLLSGMDKFAGKLTRAKRGWPDWSTVEKSSFMKGAVEEIGVALEDVEGAPEPSILVELCWESLDLSPQSFLRHTAQKLRAEHPGMDIEPALRKLARIVDEDSGKLSQYLDEWAAYGELADAWTGLLREEQSVLSWTPRQRSVPDVSVFGTPQNTMRLCEPDSLPWTSPLLSWSMRERSALRDLLVGLRRTLEEKHTGNDVPVVELPVDCDELPLETNVGEVELKLQIATGDKPVPSDYPKMLERALNACHQSMLGQFERLPSSKKTRALQTLRSAYDGYFGEAKEVWARRFQAWKKWDEREAFSILCTELRHVLGPAIIFDPFQGPRESQLRMVPTFTSVVPRPEDIDRVTTHIPLAALRNTFQDTPVRLRVVEVFDEDTKCIWGGDLEATLETVEEHPTEAVLKAIENDSVRLLVYESLHSTGRIG